MALAGHRVATDTTNERTVCHGRAFPARQPIGQRQLRDRAEHSTDRSAVRRVPVPVGSPLHGALRRRCRAPRHLGVQVRRFRGQARGRRRAGSEEGQAPADPLGHAPRASFRGGPRGGPRRAPRRAPRSADPRQLTQQYSRRPLVVLHRGPFCVPGCGLRRRGAQTAGRPSGPRTTSPSMTSGARVAPCPGAATPAVRTLSTCTGGRRPTGIRATTSRVRPPRTSPRVPGSRQSSPSRSPRNPGSTIRRPPAATSPASPSSRAAGRRERARSRRSSSAFVPCRPSSTKPRALVARVARIVRPRPIQLATRMNTTSSARTISAAATRTRRPTASLTTVLPLSARTPGDGGPPTGPRSSPAVAGPCRHGTAEPARQPVGQPVPQSPHRHPHQRFSNDRTAHLAPAERPFGECDGHFPDAGTGAHRPPGPVDLEAVALAGDVVEGQPVDQLGPGGPVTAGGIGERQPQRPAGVPVPHPGQEQTVHRPVGHLSPGHVARTQHEVGGLQGGQQVRQLFGRVRAIGIHLHEDVVAVAAAPPEPGDVGRAQPLLGGPAEHVHAWVDGRQRLGELAGPVRGAVVDDQGMGTGDTRVQAHEDPLEVLPLVVGRHDHQDAVAHAPSLPHRRSSRGPAAASTAPAPTAANSHSGQAPRRSATVVDRRWAISSTNTAGVNSSDERWTDPSGATTAEMPLVAATTTLRPNSTARSRLIASCWALSSVYPKVALLVWTTIIPAPPRTTSCTSPSYTTSKQMRSPSRMPPMSRTPTSSPAFWSCTRSTCVLKRRKKLRAGTYSASGTGCRLT